MKKRRIKLRLIRLIKTYLLWCTIAAPSFAADLETQTDHSQVGLEYRFGLSYYKNVFNPQPKTTTTEIEALNFKLNSQIDPNTSFSTRLNLINSHNLRDSIEIGHITWRPANWLAFRIGYDLINQGGYAVKNQDYQTLSEPIYSEYDDTLMPFKKHQPTVGVLFYFNDTHEIALQALDDVSSDVAEFGGEDKQPAYTLQYRTYLGPFHPLLQVGTYDLNHSKYMVAGLHLDLNAIYLSVDYVADSRELKRDQGNPIARLNSIAVETRYAPVKALFIKAQWSKYERTDQHLGITGNPIWSSKNKSEINDLSRNGQTFHLAIIGRPDGTFIQPYVSATEVQARFLYPGGGLNRTTLKKDFIFKLGMLGEF